MGEILGGKIYGHSSGDDAVMEYDEIEQRHDCKAA